MDCVIDAFNQMKTQRIEHSKYQILKELLEEESYDLLDLELKEKLKTILSNNLSKNILFLQGESYSTTHVLGISELLDAKLTHEESTIVSRILQKALDSKYSDLCSKFKTATNLSLPNKVAEMGKNLDDTPQDYYLLNIRSEIVDQQERYLKNLQRKQDLLESLAKRRLEKLPKVCESKVQEYDTITRLNSLKTQLVREKTRINTFTQEKGDLRSYEETINGLKERTMKCTRNIETLKDLKKAYSQSTGKQYDEILKQYIQYEKALEKKQLMIGIFQK